MNNCILIVRSAVICVLISAAVLRADNYNVTSGKFSGIFGETPESVSSALQQSSGNLARFTTSPGTSDKISGAVFCDSKTFNIAVFAEIGNKVENVGDAGACGELVIQLRDGIGNKIDSASPIIFRYDMGHRTAPSHVAHPTSYEESIVRGPRVRLIPLTPVYTAGSSGTVIPHVSFVPMPSGWYVLFTFDWVQLIDRLPFSDKAASVPWRLVAKYSDGGGTVHTWGSLDVPVTLMWPRLGQQFFANVQKNIFLSSGAGPAYAQRHAYVKTVWTTYRTEQYLGYFDAGVDTFEPKSPNGDAMFYTNCIEPLLRANESVLEIINFDGRGENKQLPTIPKVISMLETYQNEAFFSLMRLIRSDSIFSACRRDYLLSRFIGRPVLPPVIESKKTVRKTKKVIEELSIDDLESDIDGVKIDLDDMNL